jgi:hypothetical protein
MRSKPGERAYSRASGEGPFRMMGITGNRGRLASTESAGLNLGMLPSGGPSFASACSFVARSALYRCGSSRRLLKPGDHMRPGENGVDHCFSSRPSWPDQEASLDHAE